MKRPVPDRVAALSYTKDGQLLACQCSGKAIEIYRYHPQLLNLMHPLVVPDKPCMMAPEDALPGTAADRTALRCLNHAIRFSSVLRHLLVMDQIISLFSLQQE